MIIINKFQDTVADKCRWSSYAEPIFNGMVIIWEDSCDDYQGYASVLAYANNKFKYIYWSYGSCGGCDSYEDMRHEDIQNEFVNNLTMSFESAELFVNYMQMLKSTKDYKYQAWNNIFKNDLNIHNYLKNPKLICSKLNHMLVLS